MSEKDFSEIYTNFYECRLCRHITWNMFKPDIEGWRCPKCLSKNRPIRLTIADTQNRLNAYREERISR